MKEKKIPSIYIAALPIIILICSLLGGIKFLGSGPHIPMLITSIITAIIAMTLLNYRWEELEEGIVNTIKSSMGAILILMVVGTVIGTWIASGVVPTMIYYGLQIIAPKFLLICALLVCSIVSLTIGSSWTTVATVGIAFMGIGVSMGIPVPMIAGAIISGSYFGDKMSPLSDTTNLAPAIAGCTLFEHVKHMVYTTTPRYIISLILFGILGIRYGSNPTNETSINALTEGLASSFNITPVLLIVPCIVILLVVLKVPALLSLFAGSAIGGIFAMIYQNASLAEVVDYLHYGFVSETGNATIDELLSRGGLDSMMWTVSLILCAMMFAGILEKTKMIEVITNSMLKYTKSVGSLVLTTVISAIGINLVTGEQYLSIVVPGRMYRNIYIEKGLHMKNLSRSLEDAGTLSSPLIPWNGCGAFMIATLGLAPWTYVPFCFVNLINPIVSVIYGYTGITMEKVTTADNKNSSKNKAEQI